MTYEILWRKLWASLTGYMTFAISIPMILIFIVRFLSSDMNVEKTFEHISVAQLPLFFGGIVLFSTAASFLISLCFNLWTITIRNGTLTGRNYWGFKKTIPLVGVNKVIPFTSNGIKAIVVDGGSYGEIYIPTCTDNLEELLSFIESNTKKHPD